MNKLSILLLAGAAFGCGEGDSDQVDPAGAGGATSATTSAATVGSGGSAGGDVPTGAALVDFLDNGDYLDFDAESAPHPSAGPHFGAVRTFVNPALAQSLADGATAHPAGAAAVKELYGDSSAIRGWSVWVKLASDSAGGDNLYWYEIYDGTVYADAAGASLCTGCHAAGVDFYRGPVPLP
jgi:hypothetical protein